MRGDVPSNCKFGILSLLAFVTIAAGGFALLRFSVVKVSTLTDREVVFGCQLWEYRAKTTGLNAVSVRSSQLMFNGNVVPQSLPRRGFSIATPIGKFSPLNGAWVPHFTEPPWWSSNYKAPCNRVVAEVAHSNPVDEFMKRGFYKTPVDGVGSQASWDNLQLEGTPSRWVHIERNGEGFWVDPERFDVILAELVRSKKLESTLNEP